MNENTAAVIAYLFGWVSGLIVFLLEKESRYVRFHAFQSMILFGGLTLLLAILTRVPVIGWVFGLFGGLAVFGCWIMGMIKAYQGERFRFPIVGDIAASQLEE